MLKHGLESGKIHRVNSASSIDKSAPLQEKEVCSWPCGISYPQALPWVLTYKCDPKFIASSHLSLMKYLNWASISDLSSLQSWVKCHLHRRNLVMLMTLTRIFIAYCTTLLEKQQQNNHWLCCFTNFASENLWFSHIKILNPNLLQRSSCFVSRAKHFLLLKCRFLSSLYTYLHQFYCEQEARIYFILFWFFNHGLQSSKYYWSVMAHNFEKWDKIY